MNTNGDFVCQFLERLTATDGESLFRLHQWQRDLIFAAALAARQREAMGQ